MLLKIYTGMLHYSLNFGNDIIMINQHQMNSLYFIFSKCKKSNLLQIKIFEKMCFSKPLFYLIKILIKPFKINKLKRIIGKYTIAF